MKILIIDTYYPNFLESIRAKFPNLKNESYKIQHQFLLDQNFGTSDYYSFNLKKIGHQAEEVIINDEILMRKWARENGVKLTGSTFLSKIQMLSLVYRFIGRPKWIQQIALFFILKAKPDVLYLQNLTILEPATLREAKKFCKIVVGQIASPLPTKSMLKQYDLIVTSIPHFAGYLKSIGVKSEYLKLGFEPRILHKIPKLERIFDVSFIGSFTPYHRNRTNLLEDITRKIPVNIWGQGMHILTLNSPLKKLFHGECWGLEMYKILAESKIVINCHIGVAGDDANNMRLFEATGAGALLITDYKSNLDKLFKIGQEVIAYRDSQDLINKLQYYLLHKEEREKIANAGQKRTLQEHIYYKRMEQLVDILNHYL